MLQCVLVRWLLDVSFYIMCLPFAAYSSSALRHEEAEQWPGEYRYDFMPCHDVLWIRTTSQHSVGISLCIKGSPLPPARLAVAGFLAVALLALAIL